MNILTTNLSLAFCLVLGLNLLAEDGVLHLPIGDVSRRERTAELRLDTITDTETGNFLSPAELAQQLQGVQIVLVGESHTSVESHRAQLALIKELHQAGRQVLIGLEMFPYTFQSHLDHWSQGLLTEKGFVELSDWYSNWGYNWNYYRDIFLFARDKGLRMVAVNTPRPVVTAVREKGFENLDPEERAHIPDRIDSENAEHMRLFKAFLGNGFHSGLDEEGWKGMLAAQCTWDASMAYNATRALEGEGPASVMVVLAGLGHVAYGLGIQRQAALWSDAKIASVIPVDMQEREAEPITSTQASFADYIWGIPSEPYPRFPDLGVSLRVEEDHSASVIQVSSGSPADRAGLLKDDVILAIDGERVTGRTTVNRVVAEKDWGDQAVLSVRRGDQRIELAVHFRRQMDED